MIEKEIIDKIEKKFEVEGSIQRERRVIVKIAPDKLVELCKFIKDLGLEHLSSLSVTDWSKRGIYELTYHAWSYKDKILITIETEINGDKPEIESVYPVWGESAQIHEREMHELFGVEYKGNPDLSPLFLEEWHEKPPFRKDFDWREYVRKNFYDKENERERVYFEEV
ncbi:MAG TPA: NADH-quinone oxidoreductase subunit C [Thermoplasmatales archaeon]|nr:NADH-quinone oxidoreductase subunit C [Thermoplasmatales archaeon]